MQVTAALTRAAWRQGVRSLWAATMNALPEGRPLPDGHWRRRHRVMLGLLWVQSAGLVLMAWLAGADLSHAVLDGLPSAALAFLAGDVVRARRAQATLASLGLVTTSAVLVHVSGGNIEMHFHFFVMVAVITLYQDWVPFLFAIAFVTLHHGLMGVIEPAAVYNHPDAWAHPWKWAAIHGGFVLAASLAGVVNWRLSEGARAMTDLVLTAAGEGIYVLDVRGRAIFANPAAAAMLRLPAEAFSGQPERAFAAVGAGPEAPSPLPGDPVLREHVSRHAGRTVFRRGDGSEFPADFVSTPMIERGQVAGAVVTFSDVSGRLGAERALRQSEERFRLLFASNPHPMWVFDLDTLAFLEVNEAAVLQYGYSRAEFMRMRVRDISSLEEITFLASGQAVSSSGEHLAGKTRHRRKSGEVFDVALTSHRLELSGRRAAVTVAQDVSERVRFEEQLAHQALHDALTGLPNRALFADRLAHAIAGRRVGSYLAVLFLDLDGFKVINDSLGHSVGDELLVELSRRLVACLQPGDTIARFGGDEFLVLLEGLTLPSEAVTIADRLLEAVSPAVTLLGRDVFVTATIGVTIDNSSSHNGRPDDLVREADIAMYQGKAAGKSRVVVFDAGMDSPAVERLEMESALRGAVERGELRLHFQPEVDLRSGRLVGMEALVRWQHPERGLVAPSEFIPIAEETGLIVPIGEWVLREACRQAQAWQLIRRSGPPVVVSVNLSAVQLAHAGIVEDICGVLEESGLAPGLLRLEITESAAMQDAERTITALRRLRALGVELAIDDFGTGHSSLSYLRALPVNVLKIDQAFVSAIADDPNASAIVQAIIAVAHTLSMQATAEGIETAAQWQQVGALGCDRGQGYYMARPLPPAEAEALIRASGPLVLTRAA